MQTFIDAHPILFAILATPVVITGCLITLGVFGVEFQGGRGK